MDIMKMGENPKYLGSWDLEEVPNRKLAVTIARIVDEEVTANGQKETCTVAYFVENGIKPMILNITNKKALCRLHKTKDTEALKGKRFYIHIEKVKAFGEIWDALRIIKNEIPPAQTEPVKYVKCELCGADIIPSHGMSSEQYAAYSEKNVGMKLCSACLKKKADEIKAAKNAPKQVESAAETENNNSKE